MTLAVRAYNGESGGYAEDWTGFGVVEVTFDQYGPADARIEVASTAPFLHHTRSMPGGVGVFVEVDGSSFGVPVWTGRMVQPQYSAGPSVTLALRGPSEWLDRIAVPMKGQTGATASSIVREALLTSQAQTWTRPANDSRSGWSRIPFETSGQSLWALMTGLAEARGEEFWLAAQRRQVMFDLHWRHPLDAAEQATVLEHGKNCTLSSSAINAGLPLQDAIGVALSFGAGDEVVGSLATAPPGSRLGLRDALTTVLAHRAVRKLDGSGSTSPAYPEPSLTSQQAIDAMIEAMLRREIALTGGVQIQDVALAAWPACWPGNVVPVRLPDPFGLFTSSLMRVRTATWRLAPDFACSLSGELWAMESANAT